MAEHRNLGWLALFALAPTAVAGLGSCSSDESSGAGGAGNMGNGSPAGGMGGTATGQPVGGGGHDAAGGGHAMGGGGQSPDDVCAFAEATPGAFCDDFEGDSVDTDAWQVASWSEHGGQTSPERCYVDNGLLHMVFINSSVEGFLSAAIQTRDEFLFGRWEARIRPSSVSGVLNSFYTIDWDDGAGTKQEIDIEFLTKSFDQGTGEVHFAVHEEGSESFQTNPDVALGFNPSDDFHVWGFEISPERIEWFVDDTVLETYEYDGNPIAIDTPYQLKLNVWSQDGQWVGGPPPADEECVYSIDWIRFIPQPG